nr:hypothetical protein [Tanacetum cinerariifolium]
MRKVEKGFSGNITPLFPTMVVQSQLGKGSTISNDPEHTPTLLESSSSQPLKTEKHRKPKRKVTKVPQPSDLTKHVKDKAVYKELDDSLVSAATIVCSLEAKHDNEKTKTTQVNEIDSLKRRVKKLEKKQRSRTHKLKRLYKVGLTARVESSYDEQSLGENASKHMRTSAIDGDEVNAAQVQVNTAATTATILIDEVTLAQAFAELKHTKPKANEKGIIFHKPEESKTTTTTIPKLKSQDKGKTIMIEEPINLKKKDQIMIDKEVALKLQAELQAEFDKE